MSSRKTAGRRGTTKKRAQRATSNVFAMFNQDQIQEFKEAFNMIDQNRDGFIDHDDLKDMLASLGKVRACPTSYFSEGDPAKLNPGFLKPLPTPHFCCNSLIRKPFSRATLSHVV